MIFKMGIGKMIGSVGKYLPICSYMNYVFERSKEGNADNQNLGEVGHLFYALVFTALASAYWSIGVGTKEWNPIKQPGALIQKKTESVQKSEAEKSRYNELMNQMFLGENPLADVDGDGLVSISERFEATRRMGLEGEVEFPRPSINALNIGVESYRSEIK